MTLKLKIAIIIIIKNTKIKAIQHYFHMAQSRHLRIYVRILLALFVLLEVVHRSARKKTEYLVRSTVVDALSIGPLHEDIQTGVLYTNNIRETYLHGRTNFNRSHHCHYQRIMSANIRYHGSAKSIA